MGFRGLRVPNLSPIVENQSEKVANETLTGLMQVVYLDLYIYMQCSPGTSNCSASLGKYTIIEYLDP